MPNHYHLYSLLSILSMLFTPQTIVQQKPEESPRAKFQDAVKNSLQPIINKLCDAAPEKDRSICAEIEFQVTDYGESSGSTPGSKVVDSKRYIEIPLMYVRELLLTNDAQVMAFYKYISQPVFLEYMRYVAKTNRDNNERYRQGNDPIEIETPEEFAKLTPEVRNQIKDNPNVQSGNQNAYEAVLAFILAHEIGHNVWGHNRADHALVTCSDYKLAQDQERQADSWAIQAVLRIGQPPNGGLLALYLSFIAYKADPKETRLRDHPADAERILTLQKATLENLDKLAGYLQRTGHNPDEVRKQLEDSVRRYQAEVDKTPALPCESPHPEMKPSPKRKKVNHEIF